MDKSSNIAPHNLIEAGRAKQLQADGVGINQAVADGKRNGDGGQLNKLAITGKTVEQFGLTILFDLVTVPCTEDHQQRDIQ